MRRWGFLLKNFYCAPRAAKHTSVVVWGLRSKNLFALPPPSPPPSLPFGRYCFTILYYTAWYVEFCLFGFNETRPRTAPRRAAPRRARRWHVYRRIGAMCANNIHVDYTVSVYKRKPTIVQLARSGTRVIYLFIYSERLERSSLHEYNIRRLRAYISEDFSRIFSPSRLPSSLLDRATGVLRRPFRLS